MIIEYISWMCTIDIFIQEMDLLNVSIIEVHIPNVKEWPLLVTFSFTGKFSCNDVIFSLLHIEHNTLNDFATRQNSIDSVVFCLALRMKCLPSFLH